MSSIYEVTEKHINNLNDIQLTKILSKLLYLEANKFNIDKSTVNCALSITVPDGGEDASIKWENGPESTDWFKCRYNLFQCKATDMSPAKCKKEILVRDTNNDCKLKPMVEKVFEDKGCYILFCNKSLSRKLVLRRIEKFREALKEVGKPYYETALIDIYDADKIAAWVNTYISAKIEVLSYNNIKLQANLLTWDGWSKYFEYSKYKFETDKTIEDHIKQLIKHFSGGDKKIARIVGMSGLGKTRIALEAFRNNKTLEGSVINNRVVYIDLSSCKNKNEILALVIQLRIYEMNGILVVDNCSLELHKKLVREINHQESKLSLLTLDYNIESISASYPIIQVKQLSTDVIKKILKQSYNNINEDDLNRIAEYAEGFPQMAVLICEARLNGEDTLALLSDNEIANKLLWGRDNPDDFKLEVIKACSIFENFGFYDDKDEEINYIAENICDDRIKKNNIYKHTKYFIDKGILDKRGRYLAVTPLPLAMRLAAEWWKECSPKKAKEIITNMPDNMVGFLCNQMSKLHFVEELKDLARDLCSNTGSYDQAEVLTTQRGGLIFNALSKIDPQATSLAIFNAFKNYSIKELKLITKERRELIWTLENLCFWKDAFDNSARTLAMLAAAENEKWDNNATGIISQLFHVSLSGTQADLGQRLNILRELLMKDEEEYKILSINLLGNALQTQGFTKSVGAEKQGTRPVAEEWKPKIWKEVSIYWEESLKLLTNIAKTDSKFGVMARKEISHNFRGMVQQGYLNALDDALNIIGRELNYNWIELIKSIKNTIKFDSLKMSPEGVKKLQQWLKLYSPHNLKEKLTLIESLPSWEYEENKDGTYINITERRCKEFAKECLEKMDELYDNLFVIYSGQQRQGFTFGSILGLYHNKPQEFIERSINCLVESDDPNVAVLTGFLNSLRNNYSEIVESTLDNIANNKKLKKFLVYIISKINPTDNDMYRIKELLKDGKNSISSFRYLSYGKCIDSVSLESIRELLGSLTNYNTEGKFIALDIINGCSNKIDRFKDILVSIILDIDVIDNLNKFSHMDEVYWEENFKLLINEGNGERYAIKLYNLVINSILTNKYDLDKDKQYEKILSILLENYPKVIWKLLVVNLIKAKEEEIWRLKNLLRGSWLYLNDDNSLLDLVDENDIINDINFYGTKLALIISKIISKYDYSSNTPRFNKIIRHIIENYGDDNKQILENVLFNMGHRGGWGSIITSYKEKIKVLNEYIDCSKININNWAKINIDRLNEAIDKEIIRAEENAKGIY